MAYRTAYGRDPEFRIRGRSFAPKKKWNGMEVDAGLEDKWLRELNLIPYIEIRSTEEGKDSVRIAHVAFRFKDKKYDKYAKDVVKELNKKPRIKASTDIGMQGRPRIMVAYPIWKGEDGWKEWWDGLSAKIKSSVENVISRRENERSR